MSHRRHKRARRAARAANAALITAVSLEALCILAPGAAHAQSAPAGTSPGTGTATTLEEVVVTGFRRSLQNALDAKRDADLPIESVAPEDIGKMPDRNVAESLQRLPGVQIQRAGGQGTSVLIDGLRQNLIMLNGESFLTGREFYVSGEASGGGAGSNTQYNSLEGIPSEELGGIDVYKNPNAAILEGGIGGIVNLKTRDPLAQPDGFSIGGNARASSAQRDTGTTPNATLVASWKLSDRLAFTASASYDREKTHSYQFQDQNRNQWLITNSATAPYTGPLQPSGLSTIGQYYIEPQLAYLTDRFDDRKTTGGTLGIAFKVNDAITSHFNWFYAKEEIETIDYSNKVWFNGQGAAPGSLLPAIDPTQPYSIDGNGVVQNAVFNANGAETATLYQGFTSKANNLQFTTAFDNGGPLRGTFGLSYSKATSDLQAAQADVEHGLYNAFPSGTPTNPTAPGCNNGGSTCTNGNQGYTFAWTNGGNSGLPTVRYLPPYADVLTNPAYTTFKSNWAWANQTEQKVRAARLDLQWEPDFVQGVKAVISGGARYSKRDVTNDFGRYLIDGSTLGTGGTPAGTSAGNCCIGPTSGTYLYYQDPGYAAIPYSTALSNPGLVKVVGSFAGGSIAVKDPRAGGMTNPATYLQTVWAQGGVPNTTQRLFRDDLSSYRVSDGTTSLYLMADLGAPSNRFHANVGIRVVNTNLTIDNAQSAANPTYWGTASWNGVTSNAVAIEHKRSYTDVLPSLNFVLDVTEQQKVRFGAARVVAPQDLALLGIGNSYNFTRGADGPGGAARFQFANGNSGNPELDPYRATQFFLSWEDYFAPGGLLSLGGFYKQVDSFVEIQTIPTLVNDDFGGTVGGVTQPVNAGKGRIYGLELASQYAFGDSAGWLNGFGVAANYTLSQSSSDQLTSFSKTAPIPGVSKNALTAQVYYERYGFSARASYSWRDKAVNDSLVGSTFSFPDQNGNVKTYQVFQAPYGQLDAQIGYDFTKNFGVVASVVNLTDEKLHTYLQWKNLPFTYEDAGRRYFFGVKGKL
jgi:TonB-dependent receptor